MESLCQDCSGVLCLTVLGAPLGILFIYTSFTATARFTREGLEAVYWPARTASKMRFACNCASRVHARVVSLTRASLPREARNGSPLLLLRSDRQAVSS